jgi:heme-degrading monooxygenase HmoA
MFAVIFEVQPKRERRDDYLKLAQFLKPKLQVIDGFIDVERFASRATEGRILSLSIWRDEKSVIRWRTQGEHHAVQAKGRSEIFDDYHLRVGEVTDDSAQDGILPQQRFDATETGAAKIVAITEFRTEAPVQDAGTALGLVPGAAGLLFQETYESLTTPGKWVLVTSWKDEAAAAAWRPHTSLPGDLRHRCVRIIRDYGLRDRAEAPQFFAEGGDGSRDRKLPA